MGKRELAGVAFCLLGLFLVVAFGTRAPSDPPVKWEWRPEKGVKNACGLVGAYVSGALFEAVGYGGGWAVCGLVVAFGVGLVAGAGVRRLVLLVLGGAGVVFGAAMLEALLFAGAPPFGGLAGRFYTAFLQVHAGTVGTALLVTFLFFGCVTLVAGPPIRRVLTLLALIYRKLSSQGDEKKEQKEHAPEPIRSSRPPRARKPKPPLKVKEKQEIEPARIEEKVAPDVMTLPPLDIFDRPPTKKASLRDERAVRETAAQLKQAFAIYDVETEITGYSISPSFVTYRVRVPDRTRLKVVKGLSNDLALKLGMPGISIEGPVDEPNTVVVSMRREKRETVWMREVLTEETRRHYMRAYELPLFLGKTQENRPLIVDLHAQPHLLISGTTGSGKTVCVSSIIASILMTRTPHQARLILIDPKRVEFTRFSGTPHLLCDVIDDASAAMAALQWAGFEMDHRYRLLNQAGVNEIKQLRKLDSQRRKRLLEALGEEGVDLSAGLPYIVIVVDEFADLVSQTPNPKQLQSLVMRLAQKARAAGIHLVLATQRPSTDVVQGLVKANFPSRIAFRVASPVDSRIILGRKGAEELLGRGDMFFVSSDGADCTRAQAVYLSSSEIERLIGFLREQPSPGHAPDLQEMVKQASASQEAGFTCGTQQVLSRRQPAHTGGGEGGEGLDPVFFEAVEIVLEKGRASCGILQANMGIGYPRANKILKQMEDRGIIGPVQPGAKSRKILVTPEEWDRIKESIRAEMGQSAA